MSMIRGAASGLLLAVFAVAAWAGEVAIYTGNVGWIDKTSADRQAQICVDMLGDAGITCTWFASGNDKDAVAEWVEDRTNDGKLDVLILYGHVPSTIYAPENAQPDGSIAELFIESTDGNMILNHADYIFYVTQPGSNGDVALGYIMDVPGIAMWPDNDQPVPVAVTPEGAAIAPSLIAADTLRPFHIPELGGDWYVEVALARNGDGTRADPIIVRDGNRGRLAIAYQTSADPNLPRGAVAAEMITYLMQRGTESVVLSGPTTTVAGTPVRYRLTLVDENGVPTPMAQAVTVHLEKDSATGAFDTQRKGAFNGTVTSVTIPAGGVSAQFYYKDTAPKLVTLAATVVGLTGTDLNVEVLENVPAERGQVAIYTGDVGWMDKGMADAQARICVDRLNVLGIECEWFDSPDDKNALAGWITERTGNAKLDVLILYGYLPETIYAPGNTEPDGSIAELFIESTDGDTIINHGDYMFYISSPNNGDAALRNIMDLPGINMWNDWRVAVTPDGANIAPSLADYQGAALFLSTARPLHVDLLANDWFVEAALAEDVSGTRAEPVIVRDGNRGRLVPIFQYPNRPDPKGAVAAEVIAGLYGISLGTPVQLGLVGKTTVYQERPLRLVVRVQNEIGSPAPVTAAKVISLATSSALGRFDVLRDGNYNGTVTSVTVAAGESAAVFYYKDPTSGTPTLTASAAGLAAGSVKLNVIPRSFAAGGDVAIYTGGTHWIDKAVADVEAQMCRDSLASAGIAVTWFRNAADEAALAEWVSDKTGDGKLDVLVLYGRLPNSLYPPGNTQPDGSVAERFIESADGDAIMNHADWMFYMSSMDGADNGPAALQNLMDIPGINMGPDNTPMTVTAEGRAIAKHLVNHLSDRPLHLDELAGDWIVEAALAENVDGTRADPVVVRDGSRGRLIPVFQSANQPDPMGAVGAEIIAWLMQKELGGPTELGLAGDKPEVLEGWPMQVTVRIQGAGGIPFAAETAMVVNLAKSSATGVFDLARNGSFDGTVTSVTIPAGSESAVFYFKDPNPGLVTVTASTAGLANGTLPVRVLADAKVRKGEVAIYTGQVSWIGKDSADMEAGVCRNALEDAEITCTLFANAADTAALAEWVHDRTNNGKLDVLILYGYFPDALYPAGNAEPDGSVAELFIESTDGDVIMNHADYMFYVSTPNNDVGGLQNMMDLPAITMWGQDTPVEVTAEGTAIAPSLSDFVTDRPLPLDALGGAWFAEAVLAQGESGTRADPVIVRDGNRGRLIPVYQTMSRPDPKGAVAAEIIMWLMDKTSGGEPSTDIYVWMGNVNGDANVNIADAVALLQYLFAGGKPPICAKAADTNDDNALNIADAVKILGYLFSGQPMLAPDGSTITAANNVCRGYAADGVDAKGIPYFPAQVSGLPACATQCKP